VARRGRQRFPGRARLLRRTGRPSAGRRSELDRSDRRPESFCFAFARLKIRPERRRLFWWEFGQVVVELGGAGNLRIVRFHSRFGIRRARGRYRYCFGAQLFQQGTKAELAIERRKSTDIWLAERKRWKIDRKRDMRAYLGEFFAQK